MISDSDLYILDQINTGLRADLQQLHRLDETIQKLLSEARHFPGMSSEVASSPEWQSLEADFDAIRDHIRQVDTALTSGTDNPQKNWDRIKEIDRHLETQLTLLRDTGAKSVPADRKQHWEDLWRSVFLHLGAIRAHAAVVQARGEMRDRYGRNEADEIAKEILNRLPATAGIGEAARYAKEYRKAFGEYQENKEHFGGFIDIVKSLFLIPEEDPDTVARRRMGNEHPDETCTRD